MATFKELKEEAGKLGIRVPFGVTKSRLERLIAEKQEPKLKPPAPASEVSGSLEPDTKESDTEDSGEKLKAPPPARADFDDEVADAPAGVKKGDYLWPYEIDRNTGQPHFLARHIPFDPPWQYRQPDRVRSREQKARFLTERRIMYIIPRPDGEKGEVTQTVNVNSYHLEFPKNQKLELPESVVDILMQSFKQTKDALNEHLWDKAKGTRYS